MQQQLIKKKDNEFERKQGEAYGGFRERKVEGEM